MSRSNELIGKVCRILEKEYPNKTTLGHYKDVIMRFILENKLDTMDELFSIATEKKVVKRIIARVSKVKWGKWEEQKEYIEDVKAHIQTHYPNSKHSYNSTSSAIRAFIRNLKLYNNDMFVKNPIRTLKEIRDYDRKPETKKRVLWGIIYSIIHIPEAKDAVIQYKIRAKQIRLALEQIVRENKPRSKVEKDASHIKYLDLRKEDINNELLTQKDLMYNLLVYQKHTPRLEYRLLRYYKKLPKDFKGNGLTKNKGGTYKMTINDYKGFRHHGEWIYSLSKTLSKYVTLYLKEHSIKDGDYIFLRPKAKTPHTASSFSKFVGVAIRKRIKVRIHMNVWRSMKVNALFYDSPSFHKYSTKKQEELSVEYFRHKLAVSQSYYKRVK